MLVRGSTLSALSKALEWGAEGGDPVTARLVPLDCKPGKASCEAVLPEEQKAEKQVPEALSLMQQYVWEQKAGSRGNRKNKVPIHAIGWCRLHVRSAGLNPIQASLLTSLWRNQSSPPFRYAAGLWLSENEQPRAYTYAVSRASYIPIYRRAAG